jgi:hypothetical protein
MNLFMYIIIFLGVIIGGGSTLAIVLILLGTIVFKLYRKIKYGISMYD